jgi:MFS family permease
VRELKRGKWAALAAGYLLFFSSALILFEVPPLLHLIRADLVLDDFQVGWIQGMYAVPALAFALIGGNLIDKIGSRISGIVSGILMVGGNLLFVYTENFYALVLARFLVGVGAIIINLVSARMLTLWFPTKQRGLAMSVLNTGWPVTAALAYNLFAGFGDTYGWQNVIHGATAFTFLTLVVFVVFAPRDPNHATEEEASVKIRKVFRLPGRLWLTGLSWFFFTASMNAVLTFGASYYQSAGFRYEEGSSFVGFLMMTAIPGSLIAGWILDRWGRLKDYIITPAFGIGVCFLVVAFFPGLEPLFIMIIAGMFASFIPVSIYSLTGLLVDARRIGVAFGVILTCSNLGNTISPVVVGWINRATGGYLPGIFVTVTLICCTALTGLILPAYRLAGRNEPLINGWENEQQKS